jgi:hypothetical protein
VDVALIREAADAGAGLRTHQPLGLLQCGDIAVGRRRQGSNVGQQ